MADQDPPVADNPEGEDRPAWLPDKFSSPEALAQSYQEAERRLTELASHNKALEENYTTLSQQIEEWQQAQQTPQVDPADAQAQLLAMYDNDPISTIALVASQAANNAVTQAMQQTQPHSEQQQAALRELVAANTIGDIRRTHDDFDHYGQQVGEIMQSNPLFQQVDDANPAQLRAALESAYLIAKAQTPAEQRPGYDPEAAKRAAQSATGSNPRPDTPDTAQAAWERIQNAGNSSYTNLRRGS